MRKQIIYARMGEERNGRLAKKLGQDWTEVKEGKRSRLVFNLKTCIKNLRNN